MADRKKLPAENKGYNERLFKKGIRKFFHESRFTWLLRALKRLRINSGAVLELGCFDGKLLHYLPFSPSSYSGYDANWEGGLDLARLEWAHDPSRSFYFCNDARDFNPHVNIFDITVCMETLEHLPLAQLDAYLLRLSQSTKQYIFITVPNEKGPMVPLKYAVKKLFLAVDEPYTLKELMAATTGNLRGVERVEFGHKGFDYRQLADALEKYFTIVSIQPIPFSFLPAWMNFSIGIIAIPKRKPGNI